MEKKLFHELTIGQFFWKDGAQYQKTTPVKSGGCGCRIEANAIIINQQPPLRLFADGEEVFIE